MIELNSKSWFARVYLGCNFDSDFPKTVCGLVALTLACTLLYTLTALAAIASLISTFIIVYYRYDFASISQLVQGDGMTAVVFILSSLLYGFIIGNLSNIVLAKKFVAWKNERERKYNREYVAMQKHLQEKRITCDEFSAWWTTSKYNKKSNLDTLAEILSAIVARIKDKTCVMVNWK